MAPRASCSGPASFQGLFRGLAPRGPGQKGGQFRAAGTAVGARCECCADLGDRPQALSPDRGGQGVYADAETGAERWSRIALVAAYPKSLGSLEFSVCFMRFQSNGSDHAVVPNAKRLIE